MRRVQPIFLFTLLWATPGLASVNLSFDVPAEYIVAPGDTQLVVGSPPSAARRTNTPVFVGDGHSSALTVTNPNTVINVEQALQSDLRAGSTQVQVTDGSRYAAGDLIAIVQMGGALAVSGSQAAISTVAGAGLYELARLVAVAGNTLNLQSGAQRTYLATAAVQVVRVPEYTTVVVNPNASLVPPQPFDGAAGGVVAVASAGGLQLRGAIRADAMGFAGGAPNPQSDSTCAVSPLDDPNIPARNGGKGAGIAGSGGAARGNVATGAGGGNALQAGGGGGGNGGPGGVGGDASALCGPAEAAGGLPGVNLVAPPSERVCMGGGGGAGQQDGTGAGAGGAGGGLVMVFAAGLIGSQNSAAPGLISARGARGSNAAGAQGGGGGGAGGTVHMVLANAPLGALVADAEGGAGGNVPGSPITGPGGGGGGGRIFVSSSFGSLVTRVIAGAAGSAPAAQLHGARAGTLGVIEQGTYVQLATPVQTETCLATLRETLSASSSGGTVRYLLSRNGGADWEYWSGLNWVTGARRDNALDASEVTAHLRSFKPVGSFNVRMFLMGNGNDMPTVDEVVITSCACGDGAVDPSEQCDDGNTAAGDGCDAQCLLEAGYSCSPGRCDPTCGNAVLNSTEQCDDGNLLAGDGCSPICFNELGWACYGSPSVCAQTCGNGAIDAGEQCDDGNANADDGCTNCTVDSDWTCGLGRPPNECVLSCGDLFLESLETCDDGNTSPRDGCSPTCITESGWSCLGASCTNQCGNGALNGIETCDDLNLRDGDGCSSTCQLERGWVCVGQPSYCSFTCGNGRIDLGEQCDDNNLFSSDGCSANCVIESTFACSGVPNRCAGVCGDGLVVNGEGCDDGNQVSGDGCAATCFAEPNYVCLYEPSVCVQSCGDAIIDVGEVCDQGSQNSTGRGCNVYCTIDYGWYCTGALSSCHTICGDGIPTGAERCDDKNAHSGDGCDSRCLREGGFVCDQNVPTGCVSICGDGRVVGTEGCDRGAFNDAEGCSATCTVWPGYVCTGEPSVCSLLSITGGTTASGTSSGGSVVPGGTGTGTGTAAPTYLRGTLGGGGCNCHNAPGSMLELLGAVALARGIYRRRSAS